MELGLEREEEDEEEEEINTYHRVYAINNEAGPPLIRPLPILTNNLGERKKNSLVKIPSKTKKKNSCQNDKRQQTAHLICTGTYAVPIVPAIPIS